MERALKLNFFSQGIGVYLQRHPLGDTLHFWTFGHIAFRDDQFWSQNGALFNNQMSHRPDIGTIWKHFS